MSAFLILAYFWSERIRTAPDPRANVLYLDERGVLLARETPRRFGIRTWIPLADMSPHLLEAVLRQEDRHFREHVGIDPRGLGRALLANLKSGRWVQGGSTISQQTAKILLENESGGRIPRNLFWKAAEAWLTLDCEWHETKDEILERYLNSVYLGHRLYGVEAAAQSYFGKSARDLTVAEADTLVSHIRRPHQKLLEARHPAPPDLAPHLYSLFPAAKPGPPRGDRVVRTSLNAPLQELGAQALRNALQTLRNTDPELQGAVVVLDVKSGELKALLGSEDFADGSRNGQVNHAAALRQPGSTLKPFTYFLAFLHHRLPSHLVLDAPYQFYLGDEKKYEPQNFDRRFRGVLSIREALGNSLNIPAVLTAEEMGAPYFLRLLQRFGFHSLTQSSSFYGLALTLGSGAVTLLDLTNAYAALARGGEYLPWRTQSSGDPAAPAAVGPAGDPYSPAEKRQAAFLITSILSDPEARRRAFGDADLMSLENQRTAVKTGTSHGSRDAWAVGYSPQYAVGVWVGHSDNSPMPGLSGAEAAVPIWHAVMAGLHKGRSPDAEAVPAGLARRPFCRDAACDVVKWDWAYLRDGASPRVPQPRESFRFLHPADGDHFLWDPRSPAGRQEMRLEVRLPAELKEAAQRNGWPIRWLRDDVEVAVTNWDQTKVFLPLVPGQHRIRAAVGDAKTRITRITVTAMK